MPSFNHKFLTATIAACCVLLLASCTNDHQISSGKSYLEHHQIKADEANKTSNDFNKRLINAANIEPNLSFPAKIGLARVENGRVTNIPEGELEVWKKLADELGDSYGKFVPMSVLVSEMISNKDDSVVEKIRLGSARQHFDVVLVYEVNDKTSHDANLLALGDLTIIGAFILPSRELKSDVVTAAMLIDVISGYPYGQASATASKEDISNTSKVAYTGQKLSYETKILGVERLSDDVKDMLEKLRADLSTKSKNSAVRK